MCRLAKNEVKQGKLIEFISPTRIILEKRIHHKTFNHIISPNPKYKLGIIQIIIKSMSMTLVLSSIKCTYHLTFQPDPEVRGMCKFEVFASMLVFTSFF